MELTTVVLEVSMVIVGDSIDTNTDKMLISIFPNGAI